MLNFRLRHTILFVGVLLAGTWLFSPEDAYACRKYTGRSVDNRGNVLSGVSVSIYITNTSTLASLYTSSTCGITTSNPVTSNSNGYFTFYINDGRYNVVMSKTGFAFENVTDLSIFSTPGDNIYLASWFSTTDICHLTDGAIAQIGSTVATLIINKNTTCSVTSTVPATLHLLFIGGGTLSVSGGVTLTVSGPFTPKPGQTNLTGPGAVVFGQFVQPNPYGKCGTFVPTYGTSVSIDRSLGCIAVITVTDTNNFSINAPTNMVIGDRLIVTIKNSSGGAVGTITWNSVFKKATFTNAANGSNRSIEFFYDGTNWIQHYQTAADVPN